MSDVKENKKKYVAKETQVLMLFTMTTVSNIIAVTQNIIAIVTFLSMTWLDCACNIKVAILSF